MGSLRGILQPCEILGQVRDIFGVAVCHEEQTVSLNLLRLTRETNFGSSATPEISVSSSQGISRYRSLPRVRG